jgi:hypothetical protein
VKFESPSSLWVFLQPDQSIPGLRLSKQPAWADCIDITEIKATRQIGSSVVLIVIFRIVIRAMSSGYSDFDCALHLKFHLLNSNHPGK